MDDQCSVRVRLGLGIHSDYQPPAPHMITEDEGHKRMPDFLNIYIKRSDV